MRRNRDLDQQSRARVIEEKLRPSAFPRSASYDPEWALENTMGPNVLWLTEALSEVMELRPGMRVLDLGCGKAISSIFLAKEFGVRVWATDLWIPAAENLRRVRAAGAEEMVFPIHAEAHALPYAEGFFDALVSIDAYHYFGTDDLYLGRHLLPLGRPGARIGVIVPGLVHEFEGEPPAHLAATWAREWEFRSFHSAEWWRGHWARSGLVEVEAADLVPEGWRLWADSDEASLELGFMPEQFLETAPGWIETVRTDAGRNLGFARIVARRRGT